MLKDDLDHEQDEKEKHPVNNAESEWLIRDLSHKHRFEEALHDMINDRKPALPPPAAY